MFCHGSISLLITLVVAAVHGLTRGKAPFAPSKEIKHDSLLLQWQELHSQLGGAVDFYEISYRQSFDPLWHVLDGEVGSEGNNRTQAQILSVRVDEGKSLLSSEGTFTLGINYGGLNPQDFQHSARTPRIPWDATSSEMKTALSYLTAINVLTVKRCDEFGTNSITHGGFEGWMHSCPYGDRGGYRWLIVFEELARDSIFPKLYAYRENLGGTWSGVGEQVFVSRIQGGAVGPSLCFKGICSYTISSLEEATPYLFRVRAHQDIIGWTEYSPTSDMIYTKQFRVPSKPRVPSFLSATESSLAFSLSAPSSIQGVLFFDSFYREVGNDVWTSGPILEISNHNESEVEYIQESYVLILPNLEAGNEYEVRVRAHNEVGASPYSSTTSPVATVTNSQLSTIVLPPVIVPDGVSSESIRATMKAVPDAKGFLTRNEYSLQYKQSNRPNWIDHPNRAQLSVRNRGVEVQEISVRSDSPTGCDGSFWIKLQGTAPDLVDSSITSGIPFAATEEEFTKAVLDIPRISRSDARVSVRRTNNMFNGYTWILDVEGMGNIPTFQNERNDLRSKETGQLCWTGAGNIISTRTIKHGSDILTPSEEDVIVTGLTPQTEYQFRVKRRDSRTKAVLFSDTVNAKTTAQFSAMPDGDAGIDTKTDLFNPNMAGQYSVGGFGHMPARISDFHYVEPIGQGGDSGSAGSDGMCVVISFSPKLDQSYSTEYYFFDGRSAQHVVPNIDSQKAQVLRLTIKCWGGGGAGGELSNYNNLEPGMSGNEKLSQGGGGAFAQVTLHVNPGEKFIVDVAGGGRAPQGEFGGEGGFGGGGRGGNALRGGGGGGGGGCSVVKTANGTVILVAAGGAGGGSTDYCCGHGGAGGASLGQRGVFSGDVTPWPLASLRRPTPITRRNEYTSPLCPAGVQGTWCTSPWDIEPMSLPAEHLNLEYGESPNANYSHWAESGFGGTLDGGGMFGLSGNYQKSAAGSYRIIPFDGGRATMYGQDKRSAIFPAQPGRYLQGGSGASWKKGGGGGGAGYYGGGGGGSGYDAAGGGGGSSFVNTDLAINSGGSMTAAASSTPAPHVSFVTSSSVEISWSGAWTDARGRYAKKYAVEISNGLYSEDFEQVALVDVYVDDADNAAAEKKYFYLLEGLDEKSNYVVRTVPLLPEGRGQPSGTLQILTLSRAQNYWEPVVGHRNAIASHRRGLTAPTLMRPHLDKGVEVFDSRTSDNPLRVSDSPTADIPDFPSSRRGQSMSLVDSFIYMFGGRTDGYTCAFTFKDTLDLGTPTSGRNVNPCASVKNEVNEIWRFDIYDYRWVYLEPYGESGFPNPREQHSAGVLNGDVYIFGGKSRGAFPSTKDNVYSDFWRLRIQPNIILNYNFTDSSLPMTLSEGHRDTFTINMTSLSDPFLSDEMDPELSSLYRARSGSCVNNIVVTVSLFHPCLSQLRLSLLGAGPDAASPNFLAHSFEKEVLLFDQHRLNTTSCASGNFTFVFDEDGESSTLSCCSESGSYSFKPDGRLYEYLGTTPFGEWTLVIEDMSIDGMKTILHNYSISFGAEPCHREYHWEEVLSGDASNRPEARYQASMVTYNSDLFLFGGRGDGDTMLQDLHRYNADSNEWIPLTPVDFDITFSAASMVGMNLALTSWGVIRFGGYIRLPSMSSGESYVNDVYVMDPISLHWRKVEVESGLTTPVGRYLSGLAFIPSGAMRWRTQFSYRTLFDKRITSTHANFAGANADSVMIFGGHNGATGSLGDGSTGGMLNDMWQLRLANWSLSSNREAQNAYIKRVCAWRVADSSAVDNTCITGDSGASCKLRDLLLLAWCRMTNQTML